jgi:hypothetical protein
MDDRFLGVDAAPYFPAHLREQKEKPDLFLKADGLRLICLPQILQLTSTMSFYHQI